MAGHTNAGRHRAMVTADPADSKVRTRNSDTPYVAGSETWTITTRWRRRARGTSGTDDGHRGTSGLNGGTSGNGSTVGTGRTGGTGWKQDTGKKRKLVTDVLLRAKK